MDLKNIIYDDALKKYPMTAYTVNPQQFSPQDSVVVCTTQKSVDLWKKKGYPCVGVESRERLFGISYVTEDTENLDDAYLRLVYCRFHGIPQKICETQRLIVREMSVQDLPALYEIYRGSVLSYVEPLYDYEAEKEFTEAYIENMYGFYGYGLWMVVRKSDGKIIGRAGFSNRIVDGENEIELGYLIGEAYQGQGYAYECCREILKKGFGLTQSTRIIACIDRKNVPSIRLAQKLGFQKISGTTAGQPLDIYVLTDHSQEAHTE
jgi:RimJ/RimL family protein N-acetyltransferase